MSWMLKASQRTITGIWMKQTWHNYSLLLQNIDKTTRTCFVRETLPEKIEGKKTSREILGLQKLEYTILFSDNFGQRLIVDLPYFRE